MSELLDKLNQEIDLLRAEISSKNEKLLKLIEKQKEEKERIFLESIKEIKDEDKFWLSLLEEDNTAASYRKLNEELGKYLLLNSGYYPETNQRCIRISINKSYTDEQLKKIEEGINKILKYIKPFNLEKYSKEFENSKVFDIFDHGLSERYSFDLINKDDKWKIISKRHSIINIVSEHENLMDALKVIRKRFYYGK